ncbi:transporter substrate-binding domain-containing protein [Conchiformibius kuhniae]|uniref:Transporter substrate-binding domain-containing protein n=1 Tax=Conchiformibius kuhniae TaxID=211502 RepID=A0A8T9MUE1_9NEIS|nr:transporter substrate-binding domain-containing protein [Conchiformibius kuhniae]UOP05247.1 transporter substrate-binding domain-containing protein [Conchiformibius kuhniae]
MRRHFFLLLLPLLGACGAGDNGQTASQASALPEYRVFTEQSYPPFIMHGGSETSGFEYDLLNAIAAKQGFTLNYTPHLWAGLFDTLDAGKSDILSAGITITEARKEKMSFSEPYFETESALLVGKDSQIKSFADMMGKKIAVKEGTSQDQTVKQYQKGVGEPVYVATTWFTIRETMAGNTDAALGDWGVMRYYTKQHGKEYGISVVRDPKAEKELLGFAVKKDNTQLQSKLNRGLAQLKADGSYDKIYQKWFGDAEK